MGMRQVRLKGANYFVADPALRPDWQVGLNGDKAICFSDFVARGGEKLIGYDTVANGSADYYTCRPGDRVSKVHAGNPYAFAVWDVETV